MDRAELSTMIRRVGCSVTRAAADGFPAEYDCADPWAKVRMLDLLATRDARYDPRVRAIATTIARSLPDTTPRRLAEALHAAVQRRVRYLGEGIETFQPAAQTWATRLGDCDDSARLVAALARSVGLPAAVEALADKGGAPVHAAATIGGWWADASMGARFGEHPVAAARRLREAGASLYNYGVAAPVSTMRPATIQDLGDIGDASGTREDPARIAAARAAISDAWDEVAASAGSGRALPEKTTAALQMVQAVALGAEFTDGADCGMGRGDECPDVCHNWGGVQDSKSPVTHDGSVPACRPGSAPCSDSRPMPDGSQQPYGVCFMSYPSQRAGAAFYIRTLVLRSDDTVTAVGSGSTLRMARAMYESRYFQGFNHADGTPATPDERIANYAGAIERGARKIAAALGEPLWSQRSMGIARREVIAGLAVGAVALGAWYGYRRGWHRTIARRLRRSG